jgi:hypothetical protein
MSERPRIAVVELRDGAGVVVAKGHAVKVLPSSPAGPWWECSLCNGEDFELNRYASRADLLDVMLDHLDAEHGYNG